MYGKIQESGLTEIIPLISTLTTEGQYTVFIHHESPQGAMLGVTVVAKSLMIKTLFTHMVSNILDLHGKERKYLIIISSQILS